MSEALTVEKLRENIIRLIEDEIRNSNSDLAKSIIAKIKTVATSAIEEDNVNDINWDETDELFGVYTGTDEPEVEPNSAKITVVSQEGTLSGTGIDYIVIEQYISDDMDPIIKVFDSITTTGLEYRINASDGYTKIKITTNKCQAHLSYTSGNMTISANSTTDFIKISDLGKCVLTVIKL